MNKLTKDRNEFYTKKSNILSVLTFKKNKFMRFVAKL